METIIIFTIVNNNNETRTRMKTKTDFASLRAFAKMSKFDP
jgi:hypothetical protein